MGSENRSVARYETIAVYTHPEAKVDIVLVHGLNGTPDKTWTAKNGTFWPLDLLPVALRGAQANILVYGYNANVYSKKNNQTASDSFIHQHAQNLITNLTLHRQSEGTFKNPIIWAMSDAVIPKGFFDPESVLLKTLKKDNETLANINSHLLDIYQRFEIHMVRENQKTDIKGHKYAALPSWKDHLWRYSIEMNQSSFTQNASDPTRSSKVDSKSCRIFMPCSWTDSAETKVPLLFSYGDHHFDNPRKLELGPLADNDARTLLLEDMDKKKPWTQDDLDRALEVVRLVEGLPLAIHTAAGQMKATKEPLAKYIRSYKKRPRTGGLGAYKAVREKLKERGETAALNLMYLLVFWGGRVPVEMLSLGLKALDKRTPVRTHGSMGKRSLNKTFTVLIAFALIERDEIEDVPSVSTPGETIPSSRPMEPLDLLKIHGIVQCFFLEALKKDGQYNFWLERAAAVFLESFDRGDSRAKNNKEMGIPDDYRRYATQCRRILKHLEEVDRPSLELMSVEQALQGRFEGMQVKIRTLARSMTTDSEGRWVRGPYVSVFEKSNSASLSSSFTTPDDDNIEEEKQAPWDLRTSFPSLEADNDAPYPYDSTMPVPVFYEDDDNLMGSVVSQQRPAERRSSGNSPRVSERDLNDSWTLIREPSVPRSRPLFEPTERVIKPTVRCQSVGAIPRPDSHPREITRERAEENPFMGSGDGMIPTMEIANADWLTHDRITDLSRASHSDTSLDADIDQWAPGLPVTSHSVSSLRPIPHHQQPASYHHRTLSTGEVLSSSLPNSLASSTLRPPSSGPESHSSQPMSRNSSSRSDQPVSSNPSVPRWARRVPSATATEPSPRRITNSPDNTSSGYQSWQLETIRALES
ncbi:SERAC1 [Fusarium agapanthi]|uniref:SERAC1 n=1 Tax=Fusarium agapanthi TaxID=1803897 RepID=A0A9P5EBE5_9HYPO|nr:SERAC1 [Fusarium agapanthi]